MNPEEEILKCPANASHILQSYSKFKNHMMRCKDAQGKIFHCCPYFWGHQYLSKKSRDNHVQICPKKGNKPIVPGANNWYQAPTGNSIMQSKPNFFPEADEMIDSQDKPEPEISKGKETPDPKNEYDDFLSMPSDIDKRLHFLHCKNKGFNFSIVLKKAGSRELNYQFHFNLEQEAPWERIFPKRLSPEDYEYVLAGEFVANLTIDKDSQQFLKLKEEIKKKKFVLLSAVNQNSNGEIAVVVDSTITVFDHLHENCIAILIITNESLPDRTGVIERVDMQKYDGVYFLREKTEEEKAAEKKVISTSFADKGKFESDRIQSEYLELIRESERFAEILNKKKEIENKYVSIVNKGKEEELSKKKKAVELQATVQKLKAKYEEARKANDRLQNEQAEHTKNIVREHHIKLENTKNKLNKIHLTERNQVIKETEELSSRVEKMRQDIEEMFPSKIDLELRRKKVMKDEIIQKIETLKDRIREEKRNFPQGIGANYQSKGINVNYQSKSSSSISSERQSKSSKDIQGFLDGYCSVCLSSEALICLLPCAHLALCRVCDQKLISVSYYCCPVCQSDVERRYLVSLRESNAFFG